MGLDVGVVGRALEGDVEGDLQAVALCLGPQVLEVLAGAQLGQDGLVAAFLCADGPGAAHIAGLRRERVVLSLRWMRPIGWIGGK